MSRAGKGADLREMRGYLRQLGFRPVDDRGSGSHEMWSHPEFGNAILAWSGDLHWRDNQLRQFATRLGVDLSELKRRLGLLREKRSGPKPRRQRNDAGRQARRFHVVREDKPQAPTRCGTPQERMAEIVKDREAAEQRQLRAVPDSPEYMCALDDIARCRREWLEAEAALKEAA